MVLEAVYEQDFYDFSYGFRPKRSAHQALDSLWHRLMDVHGGWVLEADISSFFDTLDHKILRSFLDQRVRDGVIRKMIDKWLKAKVLEDGQLRRTTDGTPQGGVISPLLANVYLHEVLDRWFVEQVQPRMRGPAHLIRYADDFVMVFATESDARRMGANGCQVRSSVVVCYNNYGTADLALIGESRSDLFRASPAGPACEVVESGAPAPLPTAHHRPDDDEYLVTFLHHVCGLYSRRNVVNFLCPINSGHETLLKIGEEAQVNKV